MKVGFKNADWNTFSGLWGEACGLIDGESTILFYARPQKKVRKCVYATDEHGFNLKFWDNCSIYDVFTRPRYCMNKFILFG
jgi:hypothetical protein